MSIYSSTLNIDQVRLSMICQQIRPWDIHSKSVIEALEHVRRELFVPPSLKSLAFVDIELPLGFGQKMLSPKLEAKLLQALDLQATDIVLDVGCGLGYMTALLSYLSRWVYALEVEHELFQKAKQNLLQANRYNATVKLCDAAHFDEPNSYDVIVLDGSVSQIPQPYLERLNPGGRLAAFVALNPFDLGISELQIVERKQHGLSTRSICECSVTPLGGFMHHEKFQFHG